MKSMKPMRVVILLALAGVALSFAVPAFVGKWSGVLGVRPALAQHEGHGGAPPAQPAPAQEQGEVAMEDEEAPTVEITFESQRMIGVQTTEATVRTLSKTVRTVGRVEYDERKIATVNTKLEGWIENLHVDYVGQYVKKGAPLAEVYSPELIATQQEYVNVLQWAGKNKGEGGEEINRMLAGDAQALLAATRQRLKLQDITDSQLNKIAASGAPIRTVTVYSPASGYVVQKMALQGMKVMPGEKLFDIADLSAVWIMADIYENDIAMIKEGQSARITVSSFPGKEFIAKIDYIYPSLANNTRTAKIRFTIPNPGVELKSQMFANVEVIVPLGDRLVIPDGAVLDTGNRQIVYVDRGEGNFEPREVQLGVRAEGFSEVARGLAAGDKVAVSATFLIDSEAQLKGVTPLPMPER